MVSFRPFRELIKKRGISTYYLRFKCGDLNIGNKTLQRLMNDESVSTNTIDALCQILDCSVSDIMEVEKEEKQTNMTFSEFATMLYPYCGNGQKKSVYIEDLTNHIMAGQPGRPHADGKYQNPLLGADPRTLEYYFSGDRDLSAANAQILFSSLDKYKFEQYILKHCSEAALEYLQKDLEKRGVEVTGQPQEVCADLFVDILYRLTQAK